MKSKISLLLAVFSLYFLTFTMVYGLSLQSYPWPWVYVSNAVLSEETVWDTSTTSMETDFMTQPEISAEVPGLGGGSGVVSTVETENVNVEKLEENDNLEETEGSKPELTVNPIFPGWPGTSELNLNIFPNQAFVDRLSYGSGFADRLGFLFVLERLFRNNGSGVLGGEGSLLGNLLILDQLFR